jgi:hypothetical protein
LAFFTGCPCHRSSSGQKIIFDIVEASADYYHIAYDLIESDQQHQPIAVGDSAMNTGSRQTQINSTFHASNGHNGNNWITATGNQ